MSGKSLPVIAVLFLLSGTSLVLYFVLRDPDAPEPAFADPVSGVERTLMDAPQDQKEFLRQQLDNPDLQQGSIAQQDKDADSATGEDERKPILPPLPEPELRTEQVEASRKVYSAHETLRQDQFSDPDSAHNQTIRKRVLNMIPKMRPPETK